MIYGVLSYIPLANSLRLFVRYSCKLMNMCVCMCTCMCTCMCIYLAMWCIRQQGWFTLSLSLSLSLSPSQVSCHDSFLSWIVAKIASNYCGLRRVVCSNKWYHLHIKSAGICYFKIHVHMHMHIHVCTIPGWTQKMQRLLWGSRSSKRPARSEYVYLKTMNVLFYNFKTSGQWFQPQGLQLPLRTVQHTRRIPPELKYNLSLWTCACFRFSRKYRHGSGIIRCHTHGPDRDRDRQCPWVQYVWLISLKTSKFKLSGLERSKATSRGLPLFRPKTGRLQPWQSTCVGCLCWPLIHNPGRSHQFSCETSSLSLELLSLYLCLVW